MKKQTLTIAIALSCVVLASSNIFAGYDGHSPKCQSCTVKQPTDAAPQQTWDSPNYKHNNLPLMQSQLVYLWKQLADQQGAIESISSSLEHNKAKLVLQHAQFKTLIARIHSLQGLRPNAHGDYYVGYHRDAIKGDAVKKELSSRIASLKRARQMLAKQKSIVAAEQAELIKLNRQYKRTGRQFKSLSNRYRTLRSDPNRLILLASYTNSPL